MATAVVLLREYLTPIMEIWRATPTPIRTITTTIIAAGCGALFVTWLNSRAQVKRRVIEELTSLRAAHVLCFSAINRALGLKAQHILNLKRQHDATLANFVARQNNPNGMVVNLVLDLQSLQRISFPSEAIAKLITEKTSIGARGIALAVALSGATEDLQLSIDFRNELVDDFRKSPPPSEREKIARYLGLNVGGGVDERIRANVLALSRQVDDVIFFGTELAEEILDYGNKKRLRYSWRYRLGLSKMQPADWSKAIKQNLLPNRSEYDEWIKGFRKLPTLRERIVGSLSRLMRIGGNFWNPRKR